jgi:hypothetical protein
LERHSRPIARQPSGGRARTRDSRTPSRSCSCNGRDPCPSCAQRRKQAWRLVALGALTYEEAASRMRLTPGRVRLLVAQERDRRDLQQYRINMIETELVRAFLQRELERNPDLTKAKVASYLNMREIDLDVQLGNKPGNNGRRQRKVGVEAASRLVIALGRAPHELDGC